MVVKRTIVHLTKKNRPIAKKNKKVVIAKK
jgi:hypothetical protein